MAYVVWFLSNDAQLRMSVNTRILMLNPSCHLCLILHLHHLLYAFNTKACETASSYWILRILITVAFWTRRTPAASKFELPVAKCSYTVSSESG